MHPTIVSKAMFAAALVVPGLAVALADAIPVSRTTSVSAFWNQSSPPFGGSGENVSDGTTTFAPYSNSLYSGGGTASQASSFTPTTVYASVSATGSASGTYGNHPFRCGGASTFTYIFDLTAPAALSFIGSASRSTPMDHFGYVSLYNDATNTLVYQQQTATLPPFTLYTTFNDVYNAAAGRYRFVVSASNQGRDGGVHTSSAQVTMTTPIPTPAAASLFAAAALAAGRRKRP